MHILANGLSIYALETGRAEESSLIVYYWTSNGHYSAVSDIPREFYCGRDRTSISHYLMITSSAIQYKSNL